MLLDELAHNDLMYDDTFLHVSLTNEHSFENLFGDKLELLHELEGHHISLSMTHLIMMHSSHLVIFPYVCLMLMTIGMFRSKIYLNQSLIHA